MFMRKLNIVCDLDGVLIDTPKMIEKLASVFTGKYWKHTEYFVDDMNISKAEYLNPELTNDNEESDKLNLTF